MRLSCLCGDDWPICPGAVAQNRDPGSAFGRFNDRRHPCRWTPEVRRDNTSGPGVAPQ
jgi:hypothetical protein